MANTTAYETHIAPLLEKLVKECERHQIPMFCTFQDTSDSFRTTAINEEYSQWDKLHLMWLVHQSWSTDDLFKAIVNDARVNGHKSAFLKAMGIPESPPGYTKEDEAGSNQTHPHA
ncbi:hypothetical protein ACI2KR_08410 [Pseudomonas luteola]